MFKNLFGKDLTIRQFEVYIKRLERGVFITMERLERRQDVQATSLEEANRVAKILNGTCAYAVPRIDD